MTRAQVEAAFWADGGHVFVRGTCSRIMLVDAGGDENTRRAVLERLASAVSA